MPEILMLLDNPLRSDVRVEKEIRTLSSAGYRVTVLATDEDPALPVDEEHDGYRIQRVFDPIFKSPFRKGYGAAMRSMRDTVLAQGIETIHCHDFHMLMIAGMAKKIRPSIRIVYDAHEWIGGYPVYQEVVHSRLIRLKSWVVWRHALRSERKYLPMVDFFITITPSFLEVYQDRYGLRVPGLVLGNVPERIRYSERTHFFHDTFGLPYDDRIILYYGTIYHSEEQLEALLKLIAERPKLHLVFIGNRGRFYTVRDRVEADPALRLHIHFYDRMEADKLNSGDIGIAHILTRFEGHRLGFTNKFLQYAMAGVPVLSTRQLSCVRYGEEYGCAAFYEPDSIASFEAALDEVLDHYPAYRANARRLSEEVSWDTEEKKLTDFYRNIFEAE